MSLSKECIMSKESKSKPNSSVPNKGPVPKRNCAPDRKVRPKSSVPNKKS